MREEHVFSPPVSPSEALCGGSRKGDVRPGPFRVGLAWLRRRVRRPPRLTASAPSTRCSVHCSSLRFSVFISTPQESPPFYLIRHVAITVNWVTQLKVRIKSKRQKQRAPGPICQLFKTSFPAGLSAGSSATGRDGTASTEPRRSVLAFGVGRRRDQDALTPRDPFFLVAKTFSSICGHTDQHLHSSIRNLRILRILKFSKEESW